jgi:hypothetical protein
MKTLLHVLVEHFAQFPVQAVELKLHDSHHKHDGHVPGLLLFFQPQDQPFPGHAVEEIGNRPGVPPQAAGDLSRGLGNGLELAGHFRLSFSTINR